MAEPLPESVILGSVQTHESGDSEWTAELSLSHTAVVALTSAGEFAIPLKRLQIDRLVDGALLLSDPEHEDWTITVRDTRLLEHPVLNRVPHLSLQIRRLKESATARRSRRLALVFLALFAVAIATLFAIAPALVRFAVARIPYEVESALGKETARELTNLVTVINHDELASRLGAVTNRMADQLRLLRPRCEFAILDTLEVNALALPGGRVFVTRGLLRAVRNGEELAG
ncbi:MAG: M48 family metalloprotease, partial [Verrucomicrobiales bacterium]|nr:M48 family metalloprotease [Verrucomicrobiales bacterium]